VPIPGNWISADSQSAGLLRFAGLSSIEDMILAQLEKGMVIYDALFAWCRNATMKPPQLDTE